MLLALAALLCFALAGMKSFRMPATKPGDGSLGPANGQERAGLQPRLFRMTG